MMAPHRFSRLDLLYGSEGLKRLAGKSVAVIGLGGVGSYAVEGLVRGGVGRLTLVDYDRIDITNLNRQVHALETTIGRPKSLAMADRCLAINPACAVEPIQDHYSAESAESLLDRGHDYVLDCIDQISAKLHLIEQCLGRQLPIISSMGAANKLDPGHVKISALAHTHKCRMARVIRRELRRRKIPGDLQVVYSTEDFRPLTSGRRSGDDGPGLTYQDRRAPLGSSSVIPPLFGLTMAGAVLARLLEEP